MNIYHFSSLDDEGNHLGCFYATEEGKFLLSASSDSFEEVKTALESGIPSRNNFPCYFLVSTSDFEGNTALHKAASLGRIGVLKLLLERGASIDQKNKKGQTALLASNGSTEIVKYLVELGLIR